MLYRQITFACFVFAVLLLSDVQKLCNIALCVFAAFTELFHSDAIVIHKISRFQFYLYNYITAYVQMQLLCYVCLNIYCEFLKILKIKKQSKIVYALFLSVIFNFTVPCSIPTTTDIFQLSASNACLIL